MPLPPQAPGLVLLGARVYHPELKRWLVPDTVDPLRYTYTGGDPVNFIDPSGRMMIDGHSWNLKPGTVMFEDYFIAQTEAMAFTWFDIASAHTRSDLAWAGNQAPVPSWESAYRAELSRKAFQPFEDAIAEMEAADALVAEAKNKSFAEMRERFLAQSAVDLANARRDISYEYTADIDSPAFQARVGKSFATNNGQQAGQCYSLGVESAGLPTDSKEIVAGRSVTSGAPIERGTVIIAGVNQKTGNYPSSAPYGHVVIFDKLGDGELSGKGFWGYQQWITSTPSNGVQRDFFRFSNSSIINGASNYYVAMMRMP